MRINTRRAARSHLLCFCDSVASAPT